MLMSMISSRRKYYFIHNLSTLVELPLNLPSSLIFLEQANFVLMSLVAALPGQVVILVTATNEEEEEIEEDNDNDNDNNDNDNNGEHEYEEEEQEKNATQLDTFIELK